MRSGAIATRQVVLTAALTSLLAGCGELSLVSWGADAPANEAAQQTFELRMRGLGAERFSELLLVASEVTAKADGQALEVTTKGGPVNLTYRSYAPKVATFRLPEGAREVAFTLRLAPDGGFRDAEGAGRIDTRGAELHFVVPAASLAERGRAVVELDLATSLVALDRRAFALEPKFDLAF